MPESKTLRMKQVSFRMKAEVYVDYAAYAESCGIDLSALLNLALSNYRPELLLCQAAHDSAMLRATGLPDLPQSEREEASKRLNEIITRLLDVAGKLSK